MLDINVIWFGYIARLSQWGGEDIFTRSNDIYLDSLCLEGRGQHTVTVTVYLKSSKSCERARLDINFRWFGYIARLSQWGGEGIFTRSNDFYLDSLCVEGRGQHPVPVTVYL